MSGGNLQDDSCPGLAANLAMVVSLVKSFLVCGVLFFLKVFSVAEALPSAAVSAWTRSCYKPHLV